MPMLSDCAYTHFRVSRWKEKGMLEKNQTPKMETQKVKKNLSLVRGGTPSCMFFVSPTQPLPPLCARALMHFSQSCIADNVKLEVFVKCCLAGCVVQFHLHQVLPKVMDLCLVLGVHPTLWYLPTFPLALRPNFLHMFFVVYGDAHVVTCTLDVGCDMCYGATHHATMSCHACQYLLPHCGCRDPLLLDWEALGLHK